MKVNSHNGVVIKHTGTITFSFWPLGETSVLYCHHVHATETLFGWQYLSWLPEYSHSKNTAKFRKIAGIMVNRHSCITLQQWGYNYNGTFNKRNQLRLLCQSFGTEFWILSILGSTVLTTNTFCSNHVYIWDIHTHSLMLWLS